MKPPHTWRRPPLGPLAPRHPLGILPRDPRGRFLPALGAALFFGLFFGSGLLCAEVRSSATFSIAADTLDGGGGLSTSPTYSHEGSFEPMVEGESTSTNHLILHGFIAGLPAVALNAYDTWALLRGLTNGVNAGFFNDPNVDAHPNLYHFAFDTNPLGNRGDEKKRVLGTVNIDGMDYLTLTLPIRTGAVFAGSPSLLSNPVDNIVYVILGDGELNDPWGLQVVELIPALTTGLPSLGDFDAASGGDWQYRTFRLTSPLSARSHSFMKAGAAPAP